VRRAPRAADHREHDPNPATVRTALDCLTREVREARPLQRKRVAMVLEAFREAGERQPAWVAVLIED
jgi:hypothetical protein